MCGVRADEGEQGEYKRRLLENLYEPAEGQTECEYVEGVPTRGEFLDMVSHSKPVVFKGALHRESWPALHKWTNDYLSEQFGESRVHVKISPDGEFEGCEDAGLWEPTDFKPIPARVLAKLQSPDKVVVRPASVEVPITVKSLSCVLCVCGMYGMC